MFVDCPFIIESYPLSEQIQNGIQQYGVHFKDAPSELYQYKGITGIAQQKKVENQEHEQETGNLFA